LRTRRLEEVRQVGNDRVIMLSFGSEPVQQHLIIEFYAGVRKTKNKAK
jgi:predicted ribosome quality control (RQC) complex YloA/Tae2 family protein